MSREKKKIDFKVANSLADIFNDKTNSFYEVFLKPVNGHTIKRYLAKGTLNKYGHNRDEIQCYTKTGPTSLVLSQWNEEFFNTKWCGLSYNKKS